MLTPPALQLAWEKVQQACQHGSPQRMGEAATISAIASQQLLPKPGFDALLELVESADVWPQRGAQRQRRRPDAGPPSSRRGFLQWRLAERGIAAHWPQQHLLAMVPGASPCSRAQASARRSAASSWSFSPALRIATAEIAAIQPR